MEEPHSTAGNAAFESVDASSLRVGTKLNIPIYDEMDILLLAEGYVITETFLERLRQRGISKVKVHESEISRVYAGQPMGTATTAPEDHEGHNCPLETEPSIQLDQQIARDQMGLPPQGPALSEELQIHSSTPFDDATLEAFVEKHGESVLKMEVVFSDLSRGGGLNMDALSEISDACMTEIVEDSDLFACLGVNPYSDKYPPRHSMHVCMLATSIATHMGLDKKTLKELVIGCLIHDSGMLKIDQQVYQAPEELDRITFLEITKHPILIFDMMLDMRAVSSRSAYIAYQMHERCNGKGYPRRREGKHIHFLSKVAAVADAYVGLVSTRPHRPALMPYYAMEKIIHSAHRGDFDVYVVRSLLSTISLFPIGSYVALSDERVGRVIRANSDAFDRPVLEVWDPDHLQAEPDIVNLLTEEEAKIVRPLAKVA